MSSPTVARDQEVDISTQLALGVCLLQAQAHLHVIAFIASSFKKILAHPLTETAMGFCISAIQVGFLTPIMYFPLLII